SSCGFGGFLGSVEPRRAFLDFRSALLRVAEQCHVVWHADVLPGVETICRGHAGVKLLPEMWNMAVLGEIRGGGPVWDVESGGTVCVLVADCQRPQSRARLKPETMIVTFEEFSPTHDFFDYKRFRLTSDPNRSSHNDLGTTNAAFEFTHAGSPGQQRAQSNHKELNRLGRTRNLHWSGIRESSCHPWTRDTPVSAPRSARHSLS